MNHLSPDELIDAVEEVLAPERQSHLHVCAECRRQMADLSAALNDAKRVSVPEPSPLFWPHFSQRVRTAIEQDPAPAAGWPTWLRWQALLPLGAVTMLGLAVMSSLPVDTTTPIDDPIAESALLEPAAEGWTAVADLVEPFDIETASAAGMIAPGVAELAVLELTADEQQELTRLLQAELTRAKS